MGRGVREGLGAGAELSPWRKEESGGSGVTSMPSASIAGRGEGVRERRG